MTRFRKGTTDHDGDGHMGGSGKGDSTMAKNLRKAARKPVDDALKAEAVARASVADPQSGGAQVAGEEPSIAAVKSARKEAVEAQFAAADEKGAPNAEELEEIRIGQEIRGF